jgi:hypothetical protein
MPLGRVGMGTTMEERRTGVGGGGRAAVSSGVTGLVVKGGAVLLERCEFARGGRWRSECFWGGRGLVSTGRLTERPTRFRDCAGMYIKVYYIV